MKLLFQMTVLGCSLALVLLAGCADVSPLPVVPVAFSDKVDFSAVRTVAVLPFVDAQGAVSERTDVLVVGRGTHSQNGEMVASMVTEALLETGAYRIIERSKLKSILSELDMSLSDLVDKKGYTEVGRLLGADTLVVGTVSQYLQTGGLWFWADLSFSVRCIDVKTGEVYWSASPSANTFGTVTEHTKRLCCQIRDSIKAHRAKDMEKTASTAR